MQKLILSLGAALLVTFTIHAQGTELQPSDELKDLAQITNDRSTAEFFMALAFNQDGKVRGIHIRRGGEDPGAADKGIQPGLYTLSEIESSGGVVFAQGRGRDVMFLEGSLDPNSGVGSLQIRFLNNGMSGSYKSCSFEIEETQEGAWSIINSQGEVVSRLHIRTWPLGIKNIPSICS